VAREQAVAIARAGFPAEMPPRLVPARHLNDDPPPGRKSDGTQVKTKTSKAASGYEVT
jgi:hypothetical protein